MHPRYPYFLSWNFQKNGRFSAHSTYRTVVAIKKRRHAWLDMTESPSNTGTGKKGWKSLWNVQVLAVLRVFIWWPAIHSLPMEDV